MKTPGLWIEAAHKMWPDANGEETGVIIRSLATEDHFLALLAHGEGWMVASARAPLLAAWEALAGGAELGPTSERLLAALPAGAHLPWALLHAGPTNSAGRRPVQLLECDAPPLFYARRGEVVLLPVIEEEAYNRLVRRCDFDAQDRDHLALVNEGFIHACGGSRSWNWRAIAVSVRRLMATGGRAEELAGALVRLANSKWQMADGKPASPQSAISILTVSVRPMRSATVWSGPPRQRSLEQALLRQFMAEEGSRVICGDTTADIAARLLSARVEMERQPSNGWREVPPVSQMISDGNSPVALVTEGVITLRATAERLASTQRPRDLLGREDGASRLAKLLLETDKIAFLLGLAVNPAQTEPDGTPLRKAAVEKLVGQLRALGKVVTLTHF